MDAIELALRKCLHSLASSNTITERKRNVETFVELLKDNRIHDLLDSQTIDENPSNNTITWNEMFNVIREYTINEIASLRTKSTKTQCPDIKYQEALKLFKSLIENSNIHGPQLDGRSLLESIISILTSEVWFSCSIIIKELSHLLINHVLSFHKYLNEVREQEWTDLCTLYMSLSKYSTKTFNETEQSLYSSYLKFLIEKLVLYNDLDSNKLNIRKEIFDFLQIEIEQMKNSNHFSVIENFLCSMNNWAFKYVFDMPDEVFHLGNEFFSSLIDIWRRKCSEKLKTEIIRFSRLQMSIHHPNQRKDIFEIYDDLWMKNLRDLNDLLLREIDEICHKQRSINRQNPNEFLVRFDLLHLASSVFYQLSLNEISIKNELSDELCEPSAKRTRYEHSMSIVTNSDAQMKRFQNLFQSIDPFHQAVGFQIVSLQIRRKMSLSSIDCDYYFNVLKRYLTDERRPSLLQNALQLLLLLLSTSHCQLTSDILSLIHPFIHIPICEPLVIEILSQKHLSISNLLSCSSIISSEYLFHMIDSCSIEEENQIINKYLPDLLSLYRNTEHDLSILLTSYSIDYTYLSSRILLRLSSFDRFSLDNRKQENENDLFEQIEYQWSQLKLLISIDEKKDIPIDCQSTMMIKCQLNNRIFQRILEIYEKNIRFLQQLKEKHLGERSKLLLHYSFLGIYILDILQNNFPSSSNNSCQLQKFIENIQILFSELTDETSFLFETNKQIIPFISDLLKYIRKSVCHRYPSVLYAFFDAKFLSYLYNYSIRESSSKNLEGIQCPIDSSFDDDDDKYQSFEILLYLCCRAISDEESSSNSFLNKFSSTYQTNLNLLIRIFDEKLSIYLEDLPLPSPRSYRYFQIYLSHLCQKSNYNYFSSIRLIDFEYLLNIFSQLFRVYRRDIRICEQILFDLKFCLEHLSQTFTSNNNWKDFQKLIDAFWQMLMLNQISYLNSSSRTLILQIKQILNNNNHQEISVDEIEKLLHDRSYFVRLETFRLASQLFYEKQQQQQQQFEINNQIQRIEYSQNKSSNKLLLKSTNDQKQIFDYFQEKNLLTNQFRLYLSNLSEYLSSRITFDFIRLASKNRLSHTLMPYLVSESSLQSVLQYYQNEFNTQIKDFPWQYFPKISSDKYNSWIVSSYLLFDRTQLYPMFADMKSIILKYFPQIQANLFVYALKKTNDNQIEESRQYIEKLLTKTEYNRLIKQNLTKIVYFILLTYFNDSDPWAPEPIQPANNWMEIRNTFEYIKQILHGKTFTDILIKFTDIGEILLSLSSNLFSSCSLHEQFRLLNIFSLFLNEILLNSIDNDYLHSILRDSTYIFLRFIEKNSTINFEKIYEKQLNEQIRHLLCQLIEQICIKGFDFDSTIYLQHIPDLISILITNERIFKREQLQSIFQRIYQIIQTNSDPIFVFLTYTIQKLGYLGNETIQMLTMKHYFLYLSSIRSTNFSKWQLEMFSEYLEFERKQSYSNLNEIHSSMIVIVKQRLLECLKSNSKKILAGQCLSKCHLFHRNSLSKENLFDQQQFDLIPFWIFNDLIMFDLINFRQDIVECTRLTLKHLFHHSFDQDLYRKQPKTNLFEIYSKPFLSSINSSSKLEYDFSSSLNPWFINMNLTFNEWLISLVNCLLKQIDFYYNEKKETGYVYATIFIQLNRLIQLQIDLAKQIFPYLIYSLLLLPATYNLRQILTKHFRYLIEQLNEKADDKNELFFDISQLIFQTINSLKQCSIESLNKRIIGKMSLENYANHFWLDLDYYQLAKCASKYQYYQSAILYADIWTTKQRSMLTDNDYSTHLYRSDMDLFSNTSNLIDLYVRIHTNMNQSDEFYGLEKYFQIYPNLSGDYHQLNRNYYDSLFYYDQSYQLIDSSKFLQSLRLCGFNHILEQYLHQISSLSNEIFYRIQLTSILTEINHLTQWKCLNKENSIRENLLGIIQKQQSISTTILSQINTEQIWFNVHDIRECSLVNILDDLKTNAQSPEILFKLWINQITEDLFDENDEIFLTRLTLTEKLFISNSSDNIKQSLLAHLLTQLCENAFQSKKYQLCERYLNDFSSLIQPIYSHELAYLRGKILVYRQQDTAGEYLRQILDSTLLPDTIQVRCRLLLCDWLNKTRSETSLTIKQQLDLISNSLQRLDKSQISLIFESYLALAYFSDNEYQRLNQLFHSPIFENKRLLIERNQIEYQKQDKLDPLGRYTKVLKRSLDMDKKEIDEQKQLQHNYLISTLNNYFICLKLFSNLNRKQQIKNHEYLSKTNSVPDIMITSKCLSYWFTNSNNIEVNKYLKKNLLQIPTHFFLPFVYQMAARMSLTNEQNSLFHTILLEYLSQSILDHPHHVLPIIFALANAYKDAHIHQQTKTKSTINQDLIELNNQISNDSRSCAAKYLLDKCSKDKGQLVDQMRKLNDAYIEAAYWESPTAKTDTQGKNPVFPRQLRLTHIKDFHEISIPTVTIPISIDGNYKNIETIKCFNSEYAMVGGVNAPKKLICHSSIGRQLPQLLKGKDDLRQDAVMQQLFNVVNRLLDKDELTSHRNLQIRTYKVVPLTQKSGVLEWCEGTITFGDYLTKDREGAHQRYHPEDWTAMDCRRHIHKATNLTKDERKRAFIQVCSKLKPVFRYFFYENYNQPNLWHQKKQTYAKSIATSSIVGYIVGLGDRHVQNILIDIQTAEVIHIDLGVAFDQGKMLPIPEMIPFRLTRDIIDGLGICGTEGLFKKTCEITLELMRQYADTLITIIEVFLYDPLYQWQISPQKALQLQQQFDKTNCDSAIPSSFRSSGKTSTLPPAGPSSSTITTTEPIATDTNKMAERLLLGLRQKLQGVERLNQMTIKAHVNMLIQEATSIENLSLLFAGWQPYL